MLRLRLFAFYALLAMAERMVAMNDANLILAIAGVGAFYVLAALFVIWRTLRGSLSSDGLPRNVQIVIQQVMMDYETKLAAMKAANEREIAEMNRRHAEEIAELCRRITNAEQFAEYIKSHIFGGKALPVTIPQMATVDKPSIVVLGLWPEAVDIASREEINAIAQSGLEYVPLEGQVTKRTVVAAIENEKPTILHFAGHSTNEFTQFDDGPADIGWWKDLVHEFPIIKVVFLNSCSALTIADAMVSAGIIAAVATRGEIADDVAIAFAKDFYERLASGRTVSDAGRLARSALTRTDSELVAVRDPQHWTIAKG